MATKYEYYDSGDDWRAFIAASTSAIAQTFTPSIEHAISKVALKLYRIGNPGNITVKIQGVDGSNDPDGINLVTATTDGNTLTTDTGGEWRTITFSSSPTLNSGTQYAIVIMVAGADGSNKIAWRNDSSGTYAGGKFISLVTPPGTWDDGGGDTDNMFEEWGVDVPSKPITPSPTNTASDITLDETPLSWVDGGGADTFEIYYRAQGDSWTLVGISQAGITWTIPFGSIDYGITYEWRIDATNAAGTTTGNTWSFDSLTFDQIRVSYRLISGGSGAGPYDSPPGVQGTDWEYTGESGMITIKKLVAAANNKIWVEDI